MELRGHDIGVANGSASDAPSHPCCMCRRCPSITVGQTSLGAFFADQSRYGTLVDDLKLENASRQLHDGSKLRLSNKILLRWGGGTMGLH